MCLHDIILHKDWCNYIVHGLHDGYNKHNSVKSGEKYSINDGREKKQSI